MGQGPRGGSVFSFAHAVAESGQSGFLAHLSAPDTVDFTLDFVPGEAQLVTLSMVNRIAITIEDRNGSLRAGQSGVFSHFLQWNSGGTVTDLATGRAACGLHESSVSGYSYLKGIVSAPCPLAPPGGNPAAVPEPRAWGLLIGGFAVAGWRLRRARRQAA